MPNNADEDQGPFYLSDFLNKQTFMPLLVTLLSQDGHWNIKYHIYFPLSKKKEGHSEVCPLQLFFLRKKMLPISPTQQFSTYISLPTQHLSHSGLKMPRERDVVGSLANKQCLPQSAWKISSHFLWDSTQALYLRNLEMYIYINYIVYKLYMYINYIDIYISIHKRQIYKYI